ncbi:MAG: LysM peptidoglycan-binding domain-containing protein [Acidimicrobiales bacterium]|nr:LysM peptidoglycan-binding domain-containing protein [Acidimicrobiales bacterium]MCB9394578.1 LysM peptidoglycan-binding domain-containing protein [Acidimicrobiaceae bacterium]
MSAASASLAPRRTPQVRRATPATRSLPGRYAVPARVMPDRSTFVRRRVGAVVFVVALVSSIGSVAERGLADRGGDPAFAATVGRTTYVVQPGDTLWSIATRLYPDADVVDVVDLLVVLNGSASIEAGQALDLP